MIADTAANVRTALLDQFSWPHKLNRGLLVKLGRDRLSDRASNLSKVSELSSGNTVSKYQLLVSVASQSRFILALLAHRTLHCACYALMEHNVQDQHQLSLGCRAIKCQQQCMT